MQALFTIATDRVHLSWNHLRSSPSKGGSTAEPAPGLLGLRLLRPAAAPHLITWRSFPPSVAKGFDLNAGPALFEQRDYRISLRGVDSRNVSLEHRDPLILSRFDEEPGRFDGVVNFLSQVGVSTFRVFVDGKPELEFDVEVFPSKLDYRSDYEEMLAEVQDTLTGLAFEYLRATWQGAATASAPPSTHIEWLTLLRALADDLDRALRQVTSRPIRNLRRAETVRRADQVQRTDSSIRSALRRLGHRGQTGEAIREMEFPSRLTERRPQPTLDTLEHRWLSSQVDRIRRRLAELLAIEGARELENPSERRTRVLEELRRLEGRAGQWTRLEPISAATEMPPPGFASLQLLTAPGYREAYRACMTLSLGLRVEGGPLQLSVKDLNLLYEYWCYLALLRIVAQETSVPIDPRALLEVKERGLSVLLRQGHESKIPFQLANGRKLTVRYNPAMGRDALVPQRPDLLLTLEQPDWPAVHLVLDAKYRLDSTEEYRKRYGSFGPPEDALNAMHRYRDAILEDAGGTSRRSVVQAAALFPLRAEPLTFEKGRLWRALLRIGVGAIPLLPGHDQFLRLWLQQWLVHGGWATADAAVDHLAIRQATEWRRAAAEPVLIGALRGEDPTGHLAWVRGNLRYYSPLAKDQPRLFSAVSVAFFEPARANDEGDVGVVRNGAKVLGVRIVRRSEIRTPWKPRRAEEDMVLYELGPVEALPRKIANLDDLGRGSRMGTRRWSSRLALERARTMTELFLETEPEWRLYEELRTRNVWFSLRAQPPKVQSEGDLRGRVMFLLDDASTVVWSGAAGFVLRIPSGVEVAIGTHRAVLGHLHARGLVDPQTHV